MREPDPNGRDERSIIKATGELVLRVSFVVLDRLTEDQSCGGGQSETEAVRVQVNDTGASLEIPDQIFNVLSKASQVLIVHFHERTSQHLSGVLPLGSILGKYAFSEEGAESITARAQYVVWSRIINDQVPWRVLAERTFEICGQDRLQIVGVKCEEANISEQMELHG